MWLLQFTFVFLLYLKPTADNELCLQADIPIVNWNTNTKVHQATKLITYAETCSLLAIAEFIIPTEIQSTLDHLFFLWIML